MAFPESNSRSGPAASRAQAQLEHAPDASLVFHRDKSPTSHVEGCYHYGGGFVWDDGKTAPMRSKASNRCPGCARAVAYENMTMLRQDAEENSAPTHVLTLTSRDWFAGKGDKLSARAYSEACRFFWRAFRKRYGHVEFCGFIEWTTGQAAKSGGKRRLHSHWLIKGLSSDVDAAALEAWVSAEWRKLTGAWVVQLAELRTVGGIVGYLALHHEKASQAPPPGWTGRRLRPSKGYFATDGRTRRDRARLWLADHRANVAGLTEGERITLAQRPSPRVVFARPESVKVEHALTAGPGRRFDSLPARAALDAQLRRAALQRASEEDEERYERLYREMVTTLALRARARRRLARGGAGEIDEPERADACRDASGSR